MRITPPPTASLLSATAAAAAASLAFTVFAVTRADAQTYYVPVTKAWTIKGHGYGHGHGMSQYGAYGAALQGLNYRQILRFYYPGTSFADAKGNLRVLISADTSSDVVVKARSGLVVRDLGKGSWALPDTAGVDLWRLKPAKTGGLAVQSHDATGWHRWPAPTRTGLLSGIAQFESSHALTLEVPSGGGVVGKVYRGALRSVHASPGSQARNTVNVLSLDQYVRGVVPYEMPASWSQQALRAQAVAARTYAAWQRSQSPKRAWQICDTTSCQVYGGVAAEQASSNRAVAATAGRILRYGGKPAFTQFSASDGGWTSYGGEPYLPAKPDPYDGFSGNSVHTWRLHVSAATLEQSHPEIGDLIDVRVTQRDGNGQWGGRVEQVVLDGTKGNAYLTGDDFRWAYGLRSDWFAIAPTPIIAHWRSLGGMNSKLGAPTTGEFAVSNGSAQDFAHGRIYWNATAGAQEIRGPILAFYQAYGGPSTNIGWPTSDIEHAPDHGHQVTFEHGLVLSSRKTGPHVTYGRIMDRFLQEGGAGGWLGYPTTDIRTPQVGLRQRYEHGVITWVRATKTFVVKHL